MNKDTEDLKAIRNQLGALIAEVEELKACVQITAEGLNKSCVRTAWNTANIKVGVWFAVGLLFLIFSLIFLAPLFSNV